MHSFRALFCWRYSIVDSDMFTYILQGCFTGKEAIIPDWKVYGANMGPIWGRQDPGGPHFGPMNFAIWHMVDMFFILGHI